MNREEQELTGLGETPVAYNLSRQAMGSLIQKSCQWVLLIRATGRLSGLGLHVFQP